MAPTSLPAVFAEPFAGVLLDLDGTLVDSIAAVERNWSTWSEEYGVDPRRLRTFHGVTARGVIAQLLPEDRHDEAYERILELEVNDVDGIEVLPGAAELLTRLDAAGVPTAIVTSGGRPLAEARLRATGLPHPPVVVTADDVTRGKPHPDPWLLGAERLRVDPADCLVVEDAPAGLTAARAAGCRALVAVATTMGPAELGGADLVVTDLTALRVEAVDRTCRITGVDA